MRLATLAWVLLCALPLARAGDAWRSVAYGVCDVDKGGCAPKLKVDESLLRQVGGERTFVVERVCVYDPEAKKWSRVASFSRDKVTVRSAQRDLSSRSGDRTLVELPPRRGLYWLRWSEDGHAARASVFAGPVLCNDLGLRPAPEGMIAMCVPSATSGQAMFVPDPETRCPT